MKNEIYEVPEAAGIFIDAAVTDPLSKLVFASCWGHTAAVQNTIARMTVGDLTSMTINGQQIAVDKDMVKKAGKLPANNDYGDMTHALVYRTSTTGEKSGQRDLLFYGSPPEKLIYQAVQSMSVFPLMAQWQNLLLDRLRGMGNLIDLSTVCGNVHGVHISLTNEDDLGHLISTHAKKGLLEVDHAVG